MSNYLTKLWCSDPERFRDIIAKEPFDEELYLMSVIDEDGSVYIESCLHTPKEIICQLSADNPDLIFTAELSFEIEEFEIIYTYNFKNGECAHVKTEPNYNICYSERDGDPEFRYRGIIGEYYYDKLFNRVIEICKRLDIVTDNGVDFVQEKIQITVEDSNIIMTVLKHGSRLEVMDCYKREFEISDSLPFF
ncbi:MAG TPA: hypothetical protein PK627_04550 [Bacteroidales bacterium]|nr:hypothetical protein [Bacteroidales bacterium]